MTVQTKEKRWNTTKKKLWLGIPFAVSLGVLALIRKIGARRRVRQARGGAAA